MLLSVPSVSLWLVVFLHNATAIIFLSLQEEDVFWWTVGGDRDVLKPGRKVAFAVSKQTKGFVFCTLPDLGGIEVRPVPCLRNSWSKYSCHAGSFSSASVVQCVLRVPCSNLLTWGPSLSR